MNGQNQIYTANLADHHGGDLVVKTARMKTRKQGIKTFVIDLFCGAGGTSTAIHEAKTNIEVIACINHDENAIRSHAENYPNCIHYTEDIRTIALKPLARMIREYRRKNKGCKIVIWASLECTNHSRAKGGQSRDADSRSLAEHLYRYDDELNPDGIWIENVTEFMEWGPLRIKEGSGSTDKYCELAVDKKGNYIFIPIKELKGIYFDAWKKELGLRGFHYDHQVLNAADFGAYTSRERYFAQLSVERGIIAWPEPTHAKELKKNRNLFSGLLEKWKPVKEVLDLADEGVSIFERKKPLCDNTLKRIYAGLVKFVANGDKSFIQQRNTGSPASKVISMNGPARTLTSTGGNQEVVKCIFLAGYYGGSNCFVNVDDDPAGTLGTHDTYGKIEAQFMTNYYSGGGQNTSVEKPCPTILAVPKQRLASVNFMDNQYGNSKPSSLEQPAGSFTANPKQNMVSVNPFIINKNSSTAPAKDINEPSPTITQRTHLLVKPWLMDTNFKNVGTSLEEPPTIMACRKHHYIMNPSWFNKGISSVEDPAPTIVARQDKVPLSMVSTDSGVYGIIVFESDSEIMVEIKKFMAEFGIIDIKMRMLKIREMLRIQGFPDWYKLIGTQTEQKKYIGNSVEVTVGKSIFQAIDKRIQAYG